jgi:glycine/D-amino acid oxidase-like deaminating enzyme
MTDSENVENVILGGGEPGKCIAWELARQGRQTVVVERALIGGSCPIPPACRARMSFTAQKSRSSVGMGRTRAADRPRGDGHGGCTAAQTRHGRWLG